MEFCDLPFIEAISPRTAYARNVGTRNSYHTRRNDNDAGELLRAYWRVTPKYPPKYKTLRTHRTGR